MATHDYVIDNATGANVRADLNLVLQAILSNNSSSSAPSTTAAYMWWADTTNGVLKIRNSANNAWVELLQLDGTLTLEDGSASTPALAFRDDLNTGIFSSAADTFNVATGGAERLEISSSNTIFNEAGANIDFRIESDTKTHMFFIDAGDNRIGINEGSPQCMLQITDTGAGGDGVIENLRLNSAQNNTNDGNKIQFTRVNGASGSISCVKVSDNNTTDMIFGTRVSNTESESMRLDGSGRLLLGTSTARAVGGESNPVLHIEGSGNTSNSWVNLTRFQAGTASANFQFAKSRSATPGTYTIVQDGDSLGQISFLGSDGTDMANYAATIQGQVDGTPGSNDMPGRLVFSTTADGAGTVTERMRIDSSGNVAIGVSSASTRLHVENSNDHSSTWYLNTDAQVLVDNSSSHANAKSVLKLEGNAGLVYGGGSNSLIVSDRENIRMSINSSGVVCIGTTTANASGDTLTVARGSGDLVSLSRTGTGNSRVLSIQSGRATGSTTANMIVFDNGSGSAVGTIQSTNSSTSYNTSSDYRLKENAVAISDGITRLKTLKPYRFNWKVDSTTTVDGFFAHEVTAVPEAISGTKDEVITQEMIDNDNAPKGSVGDPIYQGIDQAKLVPLLTAALQEAITKIETLETKVAALEAA